MGMTVGDLVAYFRVDTSAGDAGIAAAGAEMAALADTADGNFGSIEKSSSHAGKALATALTEGAKAAGHAVEDAARDIAPALGRGLDDGARDTAQGAARLGAGIGRMLLDTLGDTLKRLGSSLSDGLGAVGRTLGNGITSAFKAVFGKALPSAASSVLGAMKIPTSAMESNPWVAAAGIGLATVIAGTAAPAIGALLSAATISVAGMGVIGLGAALLKDTPELKSAIKKLTSTAKSDLTADAQPMVAPLKAAINNALGLLKDPTITAGLKSMFKSAAGDIKPLSDGLDQLVKNVLPGFASAVNQSKPVFQAIGQAMGSLGKSLGTAFAIIGKDGPGSAQIIGDIASVLGTMIVAAAQAISWLTRAYTTVRQWVKDVYDKFVWLYDELVGHSVVPDMVNAIVHWIAGLPGRAAGALAGLGSAVLGKVSSAMSSMVSSVSSHLSSAVRTLAGLPGRAVSAIGNLGSLLWGAGSSLIGGLINGIDSEVGNLRGLLSDITSWIPDWKGPAGVDAHLLTPNGRLIMRGFTDGIAAGVPDVRSQFGSITAGIPGMLGPVAAPAPAAAASARPIVINHYIGGQKIAEAVLDPMRKAIATRGGNVQSVLGRG